MSDINYKESHFQYNVLTPITGPPSYPSLKTLKKQINANGQSVNSSLGGGEHGHYGLVSSASEYERSSPGVPFVRPVQPVLPPLIGATTAQIAEARQLYSDELKVFNACNSVERSIIQQISTAIEDTYLSYLSNPDNDRLIGTVPEILASLFATYGNVTPQTVSDAKAELEATVYDHAQPIATIFNAINAHATMATAGGISESPEQLIGIATIIITRSTIFANDIRTWNAKPEPDKTWPLFMNHFTAAQMEIRRSQPTVTTDSLGFHGQANSIVDQVVDRLTQQRDNDVAEQLADQQMQQQLNNMANSTQHNQALVEQMTALASTMSNLQAQVSNQSQYRGQGGGGRGRGGRGNNQGRGSGRGGRGGRGHRPAPAYCWTHGNCSHASPACMNKAEGHDDSATYSNMNGGSTYNCPWL
jgi:hypothetical protein